MANNPESKFIKVKCNDCGNEQSVFNKPSGDVECLVCDEVLVESTGGVGKVKGKLLKEIN